MPESEAYWSISVELVGGEVQVVQRAEVLVELLDAGGADQGRGHRRVAQHPGQRQLRQGLTATLGDGRETAQLPEDLVGHQVVVEGGARGGAVDVGRRAAAGSGR